MAGMSLRGGEVLQQLACQVAAEWQDWLMTDVQKQ